MPITCQCPSCKTKYNVDDKFAAMEKQDEIDRLLNEIKNKRKAG